MSESRRITLETQVDTSGAREGFEQIKREAGAMANAVRTASKPAQDGVSSIGDGASSSASKVAAAERNLIGSIQRTTASLQSGSKSSAEYYESLARQRGIDPAVLDPYLDQLREQERLQEKAKVSVGGVKSQMNEFGVSTGQTTAALRQLPAQLSDIVSSLAGGQSPFMVLIQQGGQIKDSFGGVEAAIGGIGGAFKGLFSTTVSGAGALSGLAGNQAEVADGAQQVAQGMQQATEGITGAADSVNELADASETAKNALAGLRNLPPTTVFSVGLAAAAGGFVTVAAVVGALAIAYNKGANEAGAFSRAIILSGNSVGATSEQLNEVGRQIGAVTGNRGAAATAINELVATGEVSIENMRRFASVAIDVEKIMGRSISDTAKDFEALGKSPLDALNKINEKYHFITASTYAQVKALQDQGRASDAASLAQNAYADGIEKQKSKVLDTLSDWERGWIRIKNGISGATDSVIDFAMGRDKTNAEKIGKLLADQAALEENQRRAKNRGLTADVAAYQAQIDAKTREINKIRDGATATKEAAKAESDANQATELRNKYLDESNILLTRRQQLERDLAKAETEGKENGLSSDEIANRKKVIQKQYDDVAVEGIERQINARQRLAAIEDERSQRRLLQISAERSAGDLTEDAALRKTAQEEIAAIDRHIADKKDELAKLRGKSNSGIEQDSVGGEIDVLAEQRLTRKKQLEIDLAATQRQRASETEALSNAGIVSAQNERQSLQDSAKAQREYTEEIGLTSAEVQSLRIQRQEAIAVQKEETAAALDFLKPGNAVSQEYRDQAAAIRDRYMSEREGAAKQKDPMVNLRLSLKQYTEEAADSGSKIGESLVSSFRSAEDAFAGFVTTGKLGFASLATSIISDMARIAAKRAIAGLAQMAIGALFGDKSGSSGSSGGFGYDYGALSGARALGGPVSSGGSYLVGERGPEIFTPSSAGSITPNNMLGSMGGSAGVTINLVTNIDGGSSGTQASGDSDAQARAVADSLNAQMKQVVAKESRQGGTIWNLMQGRG